ncbi:hypothetical protein AB7M29_004381 [Pseudomonas sp. F-14 TE3623]
MDKHQELRLKFLVSRLHRLAIANAGATMNLTTALAQVPDLPEEVKTTVLQALDHVQTQMDILKEIAEFESLADGS